MEKEKEKRHVPTHSPGNQKLKKEKEKREATCPAQKKTNNNNKKKGTRDGHFCPLSSLIFSL